MPTGIVDPSRRNAIARAAIEVVASSGVEGLTHRAVAAAAKVPLGSTTYHFASREDLLTAAVEEAKRDWDAFLKSWSDGLDSPDLAVALTALLTDYTGANRARVIVEYELYIAALRRPSLRKISHEWVDALHGILLEYTEAHIAFALTLAFDGLVVRSLISGEPSGFESAEKVFRQIADGR